MSPPRRPPGLTPRRCNSRCGRPGPPSPRCWCTSAPARPAPLPLDPYRPEIAALTPDQRLDEILWTRALRGTPPFGATDQPMICLSESPPAHLQWQLTCHFPPWALLLHRQWAYDAGGGPVWYVRHEHYSALTPEQRPWAVRLDTRAGSPSDWLAEREWRIPLPPDGTHLVIPDGAIAGVLIGDPRWTPSVRSWWQPTGRLLSSVTGGETSPDDPAGYPEAYPVPAPHPVWPRVPHYWWNPATQTLVPV